MKDYTEEQMNGTTGLRVEAAQSAKPAGCVVCLFVLSSIHFQMPNRPLHHIPHEECPLSLVLLLVTLSGTLISFHLQLK